MKTLALCALLTGCVSQPMLVKDVTIDGYDLVVERCPVRGVSSCETTRAPLPISVRAAAHTPMRATPDRVNDAAVLARAHDAVAACGVHGRVEIEVDPRGQAYNARVDGDAKNCVIDAVSSLQFEPGRARVLAFVWAEASP
jgi:hypothetical protein